MMQNPSIWKLYIALIFLFSNIWGLFKLWFHVIKVIFYTLRVLYYSSTPEHCTQSSEAGCINACVPVCVQMHIQTWLPPVLFARFLLCFVFIVALSGKV